MVCKFVSAVALLLGLAAGSQAQGYPTRLIKIVQGFGPGGNVDIRARILAQQLQKSLGQSIVVEAKPMDGTQLDNGSETTQPTA